MLQRFRRQPGERRGNRLKRNQSLLAATLAAAIAAAAMAWLSRRQRQWHLQPRDLMRERRGDSQTIRRCGRHERTLDERVDDGLTAAQELFRERAAQVSVHRGR